MAGEDWGEARSRCWGYKMNLPLSERKAQSYMFIRKVYLLLVNSMYMKGNAHIYVYAATAPTYVKLKAQPSGSEVYLFNYFSFLMYNTYKPYSMPSNLSLCPPYQIPQHAVCRSILALAMKTPFPTHTRRQIQSCRVDFRRGCCDPFECLLDRLAGTL